MKKKAIIAEMTGFMLMLYFFYDGIYKLAHMHGYGFWLVHAAFIGPIAGYLKYGIPAFEVLLALSLLVPKLRIASLYTLISSQVIFVLYAIAGNLFSSTLFFPYYDILGHPGWVKKMLGSIVLGWIALAIILLLQSNPGGKADKLLNKELSF